MIENLKRAREPLAWAVIALVLLGMGLAGWRLATALNELTIFEALQEVGSSWLNVSISLVLVVIVLSCSLVTPATPRALLLTRISAVLLAFGVLLTVASGLMGMWASAGVAVVLDFLGGLLDAAVKAIAAGTLWVFLRGVKAGRIETAPTAAAITVSESEPTPAASAPPAATTWSRDQASGTVWRTAADAAAGAPGRDRMPDDEAEGTTAGR